MTQRNWIAIAPVSIGVVQSGEPYERNPGRFAMFDVGDANMALIAHAMKSDLKAITL